MKQIFCWFSGLPRRLPWAFLASAVFLFAGHAAWAGAYRIVGPGAEGGAGREDALSLGEIEALGAGEMASAYFDRSLGYRGSRFLAVPFARLVERYDPDGVADAVLLDCFDDYQGLLPLDDVRRYRLALATRIEVTMKGATIPSWLEPLLVLVPDGSDAPAMERFMTANIKSIRFIRKERYYAPLDAFQGKAPAGLTSYKNNCLFCHPLKGVGGGKGGDLTRKRDFSSASGRGAFIQTFKTIHGENHPDLQNLAQFVGDEELWAIAELLAHAARP